ncbi:MAG: hypothetical protein M3O46_02295 [Myxococcota bacterium]|nr:hypothetical protein [Myxococcota bacterium]
MRLRTLLVISVSAGVPAVATDAAGAPPWVDRNLTLPSGDWSFDFGLGVGHVPHDPVADRSSAGINAEVVVGVTHRVEIGVRTGMRFGDFTDRSIQADQYGRLFDRQTFGAGGEVFANPELRVRAAPVRTSVAELAIEGRIVLPFAAGTNAALLFGVPLAFHLGARVRLDTGAYLPFIFGRAGTVFGPPATGTFFALSLPLDVWIQASPRVWLGPMTGILVEQPGDQASRADLSLGFGFGYQITHYLDFKTMVLFPTLNYDTRVFGLGAGVGLRIE